MIFTDEQFKELSEFESNFVTAVHASYTRYIPKAKLERIAAIYEAVRGVRRPVDWTCSQCVIRLLSTVGNLYFADQLERDAVPAKKCNAKRQGHGDR